MSGVQIELTLQGMEAATAALGRLASVDLEDLAYNAGALLESSARERISTEKAGPDGAPWPAWSKAHAATRKKRHSLLVQENHLLTSVQNYTTGATAKVGSNLVYAGIHQLGGNAGRGHAAEIPERPYLGLSPADREAVDALVLDTLGDLL